MRREGTPIQTLLLRTFLPAVVVVAMILAILVYNWLYASIISGFDRKLVTTSALTGAMVDAADNDWLMRATRAGENPEALERTPEYRRNTEPMQRLMKDLDLTYLYSQAFGGSRDIIYVLDGTQGEEHSPPGTEDDLTPETRAGLHKAEAEASVFISPIEYQEQWGLLKTAAAPIYGSDGKVTSTAGADVNISVIQVATQNALFASALIGIGSILACVAVALVIVRRVARPIVALKQEALRIAAGDAALPAPIKGPREVAKLRDALAALAAQMTAASAESREAAALQERGADEAILAGTSGAPEAAPTCSQPATADAAAPDEAAAAGSPVDEHTVRRLLALRKVAPFDALTESELLLIARHARYRRFAADAVLLQAGSVAEMLVVVVEGEVLTDSGPAPAVFDAASALFGLPVRSDYRAGPGGAAALCLAKPHLFTIARECPDFVVGLAVAEGGTEGRRS
jgi:hypothetical protein